MAIIWRPWGDWAREMNIRIFLLVGGVLSALYLGIALLLQQPTNAASLIELIQAGPSDEVAKIFAWLLSLLAFLWLVIGYLLQSRELDAQSKLYQVERTELDRMRSALDAQDAMVTLVERQTEIEAARVRPYFVIKSIGGTPSNKAVSIENTAAAAYEVVVKSDGAVIQTEGHVGPGQRFSVSVKTRTEHAFALEVCFKDAGDRNWSQTIKWDAGRAISNLPVKQEIGPAPGQHDG